MSSRAGQVVLTVQELADCAAKSASDFRGGYSGDNIEPAYNGFQTLKDLECESNDVYTSRDDIQTQQQQQQQQQSQQYHQQQQHQHQQLLRLLMKMESAI